MNPRRRKTLLVTEAGPPAIAFVDPAAIAGAAAAAGTDLSARALLALLERESEDLAALAYTDELTGLPNRRYLRERLEETTRGGPVSVLLLDIDGFKQVNDRHGHGAGDRVLVEFAKVLRASSRATDIIGRWGGEEFVYILPAPLPAAEAQAERVREAVASFPFGEPELALRLTVSIGVAQALATDSPEDVVARADRLLYRAKGEGRNRTVTATSLAGMAAG